MPYDKSRGIIYIDTTTDPDRGVEIADIMSVVPVTIKRTVNGVTEARSSADLGVLAGKSVGDPVPDNQGGAPWTVSSRIEVNPMAKYKPVRFNKLAALTDAEFQSVRYGLHPKYTEDGQDYYTFPSSNENPDVAWVYEKPRGKAPTPATQDFLVDEPYRDTDFNNYLHKATAPLLMDVSGELGNSVGVSFYIDGMAAALNHGDWDPQLNLSFNDLFYSRGTPSNNAHICVCIHNLDKQEYCTIVSKTNVGTLRASNSNTLILFAEATQWNDGLLHPAVPLLADMNDSGDTFRFIVGLRNSYSGQSTEAYEVLTGPVEIYPLAFRKGIDRKDIVLTSIYDLQGLKCLFTGSLSATYLGKEAYYGRTMDKYRIVGNLTGTFETPSDHWGVGRVTDVNVKISIRTQGYVGDNDLDTIGVPVNIPLPGHKYTNVPLVTFGANAKEVFVYIVPQADTRALELIGTASYAYESVSFVENKIFTFQKGY